MTMHDTIHPDDERLAALAGADDDARADAALRAHVVACERCSDLLAELTTLRAALAELPDVAPSRPIQLVPPVAEPVAAGVSGWARRLFAPVFAVGASLALVGAVGLTVAPTATEIFQNVGENLSAARDRATVAPAAEDERSFFDEFFGTILGRGTGASPAAGDGFTAAEGEPGAEAPEASAGEPLPLTGGARPSPSADIQPDEAPGDMEATDESDGDARLSEVEGPGVSLIWLVSLLTGAGLIAGAMILRYGIAR